MDSTPFSVPSDEGKMLEPGAVASLYKALQQLADARRDQGKRSALALMLCLLVLAKMAGQTSLSGATEGIRHRAAVLAEQFGLRRKNMPCQMTSCHVLARVDTKHLDEILAAFFVRWEAKPRCGTEPSRLQTPQGQAGHAHLAIDGKTLGGTTSQPHPVHQLRCYEVTTGIVVWQCDGQEKEHESSALKPRLPAQLIKGCIFTLDAMQTQRLLCARIHRLAGDYLLLAKDHQPTLHEDSVDLFEDRRPDRRRWKHAETWDKGHGRLEHRHITCSPDLHDCFGKQWEGLEQVFRLERTRLILKTGAIEHEVVYGLSSLSMRQASPARLLAFVRDHWASEHKLHDRRDGSFGEDACQTRTGPVPHLLAQLTRTVLSLMARAGVRNVARQMRSLCCSPAPVSSMRIGKP